MKNAKNRSKLHEKMAVFCHFLAMKGNIWVWKSFLLIFSARDDLVKVSWKSKDRKCQNKDTLLSFTSWVKGTSPFDQFCLNPLFRFLFLSDGYSKKGTLNTLVTLVTLVTQVTQPTLINPSNRHECIKVSGFFYPVLAFCFFRFLLFVWLLPRERGRLPWPDLPGAWLKEQPGAIRNCYHVITISKSKNVLPC